MMKFWPDGIMLYLIVPLLFISVIYIYYKGIKE